IRDREVEVLRLFPEPNQLRSQVDQSTAQIFLSEKVVTTEKLGEVDLALQSLLHAGGDRSRALDTSVGPDDSGTPEVLALVGVLELVELIDENMPPDVEVRVRVFITFVDQLAA